MKCDDCREYWECVSKGFPITDIVRNCTCNQPERSKREDLLISNRINKEKIRNAFKNVKDKKTLIEAFESLKYI